MEMSMVRCLSIVVRSVGDLTGRDMGDGASSTAGGYAIGLLGYHLQTIRVFTP